MSPSPPPSFAAKYRDHIECVVFPNLVVLWVHALCLIGTGRYLNWESEYVFIFKLTDAFFWTVVVPEHAGIYIVCAPIQAARFVAIDEGVNPISERSLGSINS